MIWIEWFFNAQREALASNEARTEDDGKTHPTPSQRALVEHGLVSSCTKKPTVDGDPKPGECEPFSMPARPACSCLLVVASLRSQKYDKIRDNQIFLEGVSPVMTPCIYCFLSERGVSNCRWQSIKLSASAMAFPPTNTRRRTTKSQTSNNHFPLSSFSDLT